MEILKSLSSLSFSDFLIWLMATALAGYVGYGLWVFTRGLGSKAEAESSETEKVAARNLRWVIRYGYFSIILILLAVIVLPFVVSEFPDPFPSDEAPIQILTTCTSDTREGTLLTCPGDKRQWNLNIGGVLSARTVTFAHADQDDAKRAVRDAWEAAGQKLQGQVQKAAPLTEDEKRSIEEATALVKSMLDPLDPKVTMRDPHVSGGLVIPLYMIVIALIGGCIGMTRRIPEYQARGAPGWPSYYQKNKDQNPKLKPPLDGVRVREFVVFQIMQAVFAPFLAVVAYAVFQPDDISGVVAIGFVSGFASEPILLRIRQAADVASGSSTGTTSTTSSTPGPVAIELDPKSVQVGDIKPVKVLGRCFPNNAVVHIDGKPRKTTFTSDTEVSFQLEAVDTQASGDHKVKLVDSSTVGPESNELTLSVAQPAAAPSAAAQGGSP